jgi:hypothetical protein
MHKVNDCLSEFILETFLKEIDGRPNNVAEAVCTSFLASTFADHAGIIVIDRPACHDVHTSVHEFSLCTPNLPWGVPLSECPSCGSNLHLKATHGHTFKATVKCHRCGRGGQASYSNTDDGGSLIFVDRPQFRHQSLPAIMATYPRPQMIQVDWDDEEGTPQAPISAPMGTPTS